MSLAHRAIPWVQDALELIQIDPEKKPRLARLVVRNLIEGGFLAGRVKGLLPLELDQDGDPPP